MSRHTHDNNTNGWRMQPQHEAFRASVPWPPKDAPVAITIQRWRRTYIQYHHEHGELDIKITSFSHPLTHAHMYVAM